MAGVSKQKLYHEEIKEQVKEDAELKPEFDIDEKTAIVKENMPKVKGQAERFSEWVATKHVDKCKLRCCREFDVTLNHMSKVVRDLNGRKIDGVFVNDVIGRYGFYNGVMINRVALAAKYNRSVEEIEFVHDKVKFIVQHEDFLKAYNDYVDGVKKEVIKDIDNNNKFGE